MKRSIGLSGPALTTVLIFVVVILAIAGCGIWLLSRTRDLQNQSSALTQQIAAMQSRSAGGQVNSLAALVTAEEALAIPWATVMKGVSASMASGNVTVDTLDGTGTNLQLSGRSTGLSAISQFTQSLKTYSWVSSIQVQSINESPASGFSIFPSQALIQTSGGKKIQVVPKYSYTYDLTVILKSGSGDGQ